MASSKCTFYYGPESQYGKFRFGGDPEGTIDIYNDHIDVFKKSKTAALMFGAIGSALSGKGKPETTIQKYNVVAYRADSGSYWLYLANGNVMCITLQGFNTRDAQTAIMSFVSGIPAR